MSGLTDVNTIEVKDFNTNELAALVVENQAALDIIRAKGWRRTLFQLDQ